MRQLGYEIVETGDIVWTLKDKKTVESCGHHTVTKLFDLPEKRYIPKVRPWKVENGKLIRQTV